MHQITFADISILVIGPMVPRHCFVTLANNRRTIALSVCVDHCDEFMMMSADLARELIFANDANNEGRPWYWTGDPSGLSVDEPSASFGLSERERRELWAWMERGRNIVQEIPGEARRKFRPRIKPGQKVAKVWFPWTQTLWDKGVRELTAGP